MRPIRDLPIKHKLMAIIMAVAGSALLFSGIALVFVDVILFQQGLRRDLTALAQILGDNSTAALAFDDPQAASETLATLQVRPHVMAACIYRENATVLAGYIHQGANVQCPSAPHGAASMHFTAERVTVTRPIELAGRRVGGLILIYDLGEQYVRSGLYAEIVLGVLLVSGLFAFLLSSRLRAIIATPISELAEATTSVAATRDYSLRAHKVSNDELGVLVGGFNEMLAGIQARDTELKQALREVQLAKDLLTTTLASIGDAVVSTDREGNTVFANPVACSLLRCREADLTGRPLSDALRLVDEETRQPLESPVAQVLRGGVMAALENHTVLVARDGAEVPIDDSAAPIRNARGELVGAVMVFRDITDRKQVERELRAAREQLQMVTDTMAPAVAHVSRDLEYIWVSRRFAEWLNTTPDAIAGRSQEAVLGAEAMATIRPFTERALAGERVEYETRIHYASIGWRWIRAVYVPTRDAEGAVTGWVADVTDLTDLKNAEAEVVRINADLARTNERLARSNEDLERFVFVASHDLQEPLRMITTYAQLFARSHAGQLDEDAETLLRNMIASSKRMRDLLVDLLSYTELSEDPDEPERKVDMNAALATAKENLKVAIDESGAEIVAGDLPALVGFEAHFVSLLQNLIGNAIKYRSLEPPRIQIGVEAQDGSLRFAVRDNGIGIEPQYHEKIFEVFRRLHGKKIPGTGVGLAICQRVVERYGGRIWVESEAGQGAKFVFTLPGIAVRSAGKVS